jgi:phenylacetate-CoA ligase
LWGEIGGSVPSFRKKLSGAWNGVSIFDIYACQEFGVLASECNRHRGLHGFEDFFVYEIVDPDTGELLHEGETGELVVTPLYPATIPLIRYRTGDLTSLRRGCACGRSHVILDGIGGRLSDALAMKSKDRMVLPSSVENAVHGNPHLTGSYRILPEEGSVEVEAREHKGMVEHYIKEAGWPPVPFKIERVVPKFFHIRKRVVDGDHDRLLREQARLEG